jgi:tripartite-type tricarboxylate transporter receptor subunit TctC
MKVLDRALTTVCIFTSVLAAAPQPAVAQSEYPTRLIRVICVNAPGGGLDVIGRLVADRMTKNMHQSVIVENRAGAGGNIASEYVARIQADGYTLLETTNNHNINSFIYKSPGYDPRKDFAPVIQLTEAPSVIVTRTQSPYQTIKEVISAARAQPGKIAYANAGAGQPTHIAGEMFKKAAGIDLLQIPYKGGGPANQDVIGGQVPIGMSALPAVTPLIQAGTLRALAVTSEKRWPTLPDVPSIAEIGYPKFSHLTWIGILVPTGTPPAIVSRLNREIAAILTNADMKERIVGLGAAPVGRSPADFAAMLKDEYEVTQKLVAEIGLKVD